MIEHVASRGITCAIGVTFFAAALAATAPTAAQSGDPIKIGFSLALTGPLAPNGKQALLGAKIWEEEINAKGGLIGRKVELVNYDDQSNPANVPGIYTKLLDVDKVDLVIGPYGTNLNAPALPVVIQRGKTFIGFFALDVNAEFHYPKYFSMLPAGPKPREAFTEGFFQVAAAQNPKPQTVALTAEDAEFARNACEGARENAKTFGFKVIYDKTFPPGAHRRRQSCRALQAANADLSRKSLGGALSSVGIVQTAKDRCKPENARRRDGRPESTVFKDWFKSQTQLASCNYETWVPVHLPAPAMAIGRGMQGATRPRVGRSASSGGIGLRCFRCRVKTVAGRQEHPLREQPASHCIRRRS